MFRIPRVFYPADQLIVFLPEHKTYKLSAEPSVSVFAAQRAPVFFNEFGDFFQDGPEQDGVFFLFQVEDGPQVQFSRAGMGVMHARQIIFFQDEIELTDISREFLYIHGCIFDHRHGFRISGDVGEQA